MTWLRPNRRTLAQLRQLAHLTRRAEDLRVKIVSMCNWRSTTLRRGHHALSELTGEFPMTQRVSYTLIEQIAKKDAVR